MTVNANANISGALEGIHAVANGSGAVTVNVAPGVAIIGTASNSYGIHAYNFGGGGAVEVSLSPDDLVTSGSAGIVAENYALAVPQSAHSTIVVNAAGTINSGATPH